MQIISRGIEILRNDGPLSFFRAILRFIYWNLGVRTANITLRYKMTGSTTAVTVENISANMFITTYAEFERFYDLKGEREILRDVLGQVSENDVFYDIGANVGLYSCMISSAIPKCEVYPFEPHPTNVEALKRNLQLNDIGGQIFQLALSDEEGEFELSSEGAEAGLGEHSLDTSGTGSTVPVTVRRLDDLRKDHDIPIPTVVKIDVEGAELDVIRGAKETFSDPNCKVIYCEVHPERIETFGGSYDELKDCLIDLGFALEILDQEVGKRIMIKATK